MRRLAVLLCLGFAVNVCGASEKRLDTIDDFDYADAAAAGKAWHLVDRSDPVLLGPGKAGGKDTALKVPCNFSQSDVDAVSVERAVSLDMSLSRALRVDVYLDNPALLRAFRIELCSGEGFYRYEAWYEIKARQPGWWEIVLDKGNFKAQGKPTGWHRIDKVRFVALKDGVDDTFFMIDNLQSDSSRTAEIALVRSGDTRTHWKLEMRFSIMLSQMVGVPIDRIRSRGVEAGQLDGYKIAIFPHSLDMSAEEISKVQQFVAGGGKIFVFDEIAPPLAKLLGMKTSFPQAPEYKGQFAKIRFDGDGLDGLVLNRFRHDPVTAITEIAEGARVVGKWYDKEGKQAGPAVVLSENGAFFPTMLWPQQRPEEKEYFLWLVNHFLPAPYKQRMAEKALASAWNGVGYLPDKASLTAYLDDNVKGRVNRARMLGHLSATETIEGQMRKALDDGDYSAVSELRALMSSELVDAYVLSHKGRQGEFRGMWVTASPRREKGARGLYSWDEFCRLVSAANFNAVIPLMAAGGYAYYKSDVLPGRGVEAGGDQLAKCVAAARKYGLEVHVWKLTYAQASSQVGGAFSVDNKGNSANSLCPSDPVNIALERDVWVEMVTNYDIDGIQFDIIRYRGKNYCYCDGCRKRFEAQRSAKVENWPEDCYSGILRQEYRDFRVEQINTLVKTVSEAVRKVKPYIKISADVFGGWPRCKDTVGQDWVTWARQGWIDVLCPMDYYGEKDFFTGLVMSQAALVGADVSIYVGLDHRGISTDREMAEIGILRAQGADGFIFYDMNRRFEEYTRMRLIETLLPTKTFVPHHGPEIRYEIVSSEPMTVWPPARVTFADELTVRVINTSLGAYRGKQPVAAVGRIELQDTAGQTLAILAETLPAPAGETKLKIARRNGLFRLAAVGNVSFEDGSSQPFIRRSRPYRFAKAD